MSKRHDVSITAGAERDIAEIVEYIDVSDSPQNADRVLDGLLAAIGKLAELPERGSHPRELLALGIRDFRQVFFKPYRIVYRTVAGNVFVYLVADGRRDMQTLLARRLIDERME
ncbi:MAG: type II toxin-antitoxin system RelE/ParE family toxin [Proteobacteria bacterium]|nr:type II toxin-antitoxin system RelE/ParE family toxin [Pseudomonadota bacterium]